jgi:hypothetical protein
MSFCSVHFLIEVGTHPSILAKVHTFLCNTFSNPEHGNLAIL